MSFNVQSPNLKISDENSELISKYTKILKQNNIFDEILNVLVKDSNLRGENFASITNYVTINFTKDRAPLHLFTKRKTESDSYNETLNDTKVFEKEGSFFMEYLPLAKQLCKSKGKEDLIKIYPKCYFADSNLLVFENLVEERRFQLLDKLEKQNYEAATLSMMNLAKHHALSNAVIIEFGGSEKFFKKFPYLENFPLLESSSGDLFAKAIEESITMNIEILKESKLNECQWAIDKLNTFRGKVLERIRQLHTQSEACIHVLNHGDYWNNNMLFLKHESHIIAQIPVDFQWVHHGPPVFDLAYYFFTSLKGNLRREKIRELLTTYLKTLNATSEELGHPLNYTFSQLWRDYCLNFEMGFYFGNFNGLDLGFSVMKNADISKMQNMEEWTMRMDELIRKWLETHPKEKEEFAQTLIDEMKEYEQLKTQV